MICSSLNSTKQTWNTLDMNSRQHIKHNFNIPRQKRTFFTCFCSRSSPSIVWNVKDSFTTVFIQDIIISSSLLMFECLFWLKWRFPPPQTVFVIKRRDLIYEHQLALGVMCFACVTDLFWQFCPVYPLHWKWYCLSICLCGPDSWPAMKCCAL